MSWVWILLCWLVGFGLVLLEIFMPGVVLGVLGTTLVLGSVVAMFAYHGGLAGAGLTLGSLGLGAALIKLGVARLASYHQLSEETGYVGTDDLSALLGETGVASTMLRPGGFATIGGQRVDVVTRGEHLPQGTPVVVVAVEGNVVEVRAQES